MSTHPMEALLRPPVELWSTATAFAAGTLAWLAPWALMMPPGIAAGTGLTFFGFGVWRGRQAWRVLRYQHHMKRLPEYRVRPAQIPVSRHKLFLGKGFRWTQKHTQRLRDTHEVPRSNDTYNPARSISGPRQQGSRLGDHADTRQFACGGAYAAAPAGIH
jgi:hypothetical protein